MSKITQLAECTITAFAIVRVELVEADETPAAVIVHWPAKATVLHPRRFPETAAGVVRTFSAAAVELAHIKSERKL
jgi:hypothetical protein